jgi:hypothetical protein
MHTHILWRIRCQWTASSRLFLDSQLITSCSLTYTIKLPIQRLYLNFQTETSQVVLCRISTLKALTAVDKNIFFDVESSLFRTTHKKREITLNDKQLIVHGDDGKIIAQIELSDIKGVEVKSSIVKQYAQLRLQLQDNTSKCWNIPIGASDYWKRVFYTRIHPYLEVIFIQTVLRENSLS